MAVYISVQDDVVELVSRARNVREEILILERVVSERREGINKAMSSSGSIAAGILSAIYTVQVLDRRAHCETAWTLPVIITIAYLGAIASIVPMVYAQFAAFRTRQHLFRELKSLVNVSSREGALLMRNDLHLFISLRSIQMEVDLRGEQSLVLFCARKVGFLLWFTVFYLVLLVACSRLLC